MKGRYLISSRKPYPCLFSKSTDTSLICGQTLSVGYFLGCHHFLSHFPHLTGGILTRDCPEVGFAVWDHLQLLYTDQSALFLHAHRFWEGEAPRLIPFDKVGRAAYGCFTEHYAHWAALREKEHLVGQLANSAVGGYIKPRKI